jgi:V8-like Glu-specific endopeptidase
MLKIKSVIGLSFLLSAFAPGAWAFPFHPGQDLAMPAPAGDAPALAGVDFNAIVALNNCSGSLVRFAGSLGTDHAMVLTNGHCFEGGFIDAGQFVSNVASTRTFTLLSRDGKSSLGKLRAEKALFATMTGTDMTLYRLTETFDAIESRTGVRALTFSSKHPEAARGIAVASGYWKKIYTCAIDGFVYRLKEDQWTFVDSIRYSKPGCETIGGTSGSPVIDTETLEVVGVNNTGNDSGETCTMDNPCEVTADGVITAIKGTSYAQETYWLYSCLTADSQLDLNKQGCQRPF